MRCPFHQSSLRSPWATHRSPLPLLPNNMLSQKRSRRNTLRCRSTCLHQTLWRRSFTWVRARLTNHAPPLAPRSTTIQCPIRSMRHRTRSFAPKARLLLSTYKHLRQSPPRRLLFHSLPLPRSPHLLRRKWPSPRPQQHDIDHRSPSARACSIRSSARRDRHGFLLSLARKTVNIYMIGKR